jgi:mannosyltransferase OCH1-like enzyme
MRRLVFLGLVSSLVLLTFLIHLFSTLLGLLVEDGSADAILLTELPRHTAPKDAPMRFEPSQPQLIPKIIHQTYKNESIPERWKEPWQQCQDIMKADYEFKVRTPSSATLLEREERYL